MYKRIASLSLDAILYGASIRNRCKRNGDWTLGAFAFLLLELREHEAQVEALDPMAFLKYQQIVEVAYEYFHAHADSAQVREIDHRVRRAVGKAADRGRRRASRSLTDSETIDLQLILRSAEKIGDDLNDLLPGA